MSISYQSSDAAVQAAGLKWQTLCLKEEDSEIVSNFTSATLTVDLKQALANNGTTFAAGTKPVIMKVLAAGGTVVAPTTIAFTTGALFKKIDVTFAAPCVSGDAIIVNYIVAE